MFPCGVTEFTGVFGIAGKVAPCRKDNKSATLKQPNRGLAKCFVMQHQKSTFAIDIAMASREPPVKVKCTYSLYVAVSRAVEQHSLLNIQCSLDFSQLCFLP